MKSWVLQGKDFFYFSPKESVFADMLVKVSLENRSFMGQATEIILENILFTENRN